MLTVGSTSITMSANATGNGTAQGLQFATWVVFPTPYHAIPNTVVTPVSISAASGTATNETALGFVPLIWNSAGNSIAGIANWQSTGQ